MATTGGSGNDTLFGGTGNDALAGYAGNDTYQYVVGSGQDTVSDTGGTDTLLLGNPGNLDIERFDIYRSGNSLVFDFLTAGKVTVLNQFGATPPATRLEYFATDDGWGPFLIQNGLTGTAGNDLIVGSAAAETLSGGLGDDLLWGGAGNDALVGGDGENELHAGTGNDTLLGGIDEDELYSGAGTDRLDGGNGFDTANYEDQTTGVFVNLSGEEQAYDNRLFASGQVYETGTRTVDTLVSIESVIGTRYADYVVLGRTDSETDLYLGKGNDTVVGGATSDEAWASIGYWDDPSGIIVNLSAKALPATLDGVTYYVGRNTARDGWGNTDTFILDGNLSISGSEHADYLRGRDDSDQDRFNDFFDGGKGNDTLDGGTGSYDGVGYWAEDDALYGAVVNLSSTARTLSFYGASVTVNAGSARDAYGGIDTLKNIELVSGSDLNDYIIGSAANNGYLGGQEGNDTLLGGGGVDSLYGDQGNDLLKGETGNDYLVGDEGNDVLNGGAGADMLLGGSGSDRFDFDSLSELGIGSGRDLIQDFMINTLQIVGDKIDLSTIDANPLLANDQAFKLVSAFSTTAPTTGFEVLYNNGVIALNTDSDTFADYEIQLVGTVPTALTAADFIL